MVLKVNKGFAFIVREIAVGELGDAEDEGKTAAPWAVEVVPGNWDAIVYMIKLKDGNKRKRESKTGKQQKWTQFMEREHGDDDDKRWSGEVPLRVRIWIGSSQTRGIGQDWLINKGSVGHQET